MATFNDVLKSFTASQNANLKAQLGLAQLDFDKRKYADALNQQALANQFTERDYNLRADQFDALQDQRRVDNYFAQMRDAREAAAENREAATFKQEQERADAIKGIDKLIGFGYGDTVEKILLGELDVVDFIQRPEGQEFAAIVQGDEYLRNKFGGVITNIVNPNTGGAPQPDEPHVIEIANDSTGTTSAITENRSSDDGDQVLVFDRAGVNRAFRSALLGEYLTSGAAPMQDSQRLAAIANNQSQIPGMFDFKQFALNGGQSVGLAKQPVPDQPATAPNPQTPMQIPVASTPDSDLSGASIAEESDAISMYDQREQQLLREIEALENNQSVVLGTGNIRTAVTNSRDRRKLLDAKRAELEDLYVRRDQNLPTSALSGGGPKEETVEIPNANPLAGIATPQSSRVVGKTNELVASVNPSLAESLIQQANTATKNLDKLQRGVNAKALTGSDIALLNRLKDKKILPDSTYENLLGRQGADGDRQANIGRVMDDQIDLLKSSGQELRALETNRVTNQRQRDEFEATQREKRSTAINDAIDKLDETIVEALQSRGEINPTMQTIISQQGKSAFVGSYVRSGVRENPNIWESIFLNQGTARSFADSFVDYQQAVNEYNDGDLTEPGDWMVGKWVGKTSVVKTVNDLLRSDISRAKGMDVVLLAQQSGMPFKSFVNNVLGPALEVRGAKGVTPQTYKQAVSDIEGYRLAMQAQNQPVDPQLVQDYLRGKLAGRY